jgi:hypothetical protein
MRRVCDVDGDEIDHSRVTLIVAATVSVKVPRAGV